MARPPSDTRPAKHSRPGDPESILIRTMRDGDSIEELTQLLNRAYGRFIKSGVRMKAAVQQPSETRKRTARGECLVAEIGGRLVGTLVWRRPGRPHSPCRYYRDPSVATFEELAVNPQDQGRGIGAKLLREAESRAQKHGAREMACDTAANSTSLVDWYRSCGYGVVAEVRWPNTNHLNVVLSKRLV